MGLFGSKPVPVRGQVPAGRVRLGVAGFGLSHHTQRARSIAEEIVKAHPDQFESWFYFDSAGYRGEGGFLPQLKSELSQDQQEKFAAKNSSPFCWLEYPDGKKEALGGRDDFCDWVNNPDNEFSNKFAANSTLKELAITMPRIGELWVDETPGTAK